MSWIRLPLLALSHFCGGLVSSSMTVLHKRTSSLLYCPFMTHSQVRFLGLKITRFDSDLADRRRLPFHPFHASAKRKNDWCNRNLLLKHVHESHFGRFYHNHRHCLNSCGNLLQVQIGLHSQRVSLAGTEEFKGWIQSCSSRQGFELDAQKIPCPLCEI